MNSLYVDFGVNVLCARGKIFLILIDQHLEILKHQVAIIRFRQMFSAHPRISQVPRGESGCYLCATCDPVIFRPRFPLTTMKREKCERQARGVGYVYFYYLSIFYYLSFISYLSALHPLRVLFQLMICF